MSPNRLGYREPATHVEPRASTMPRPQGAEGTKSTAHYAIGANLLIAVAKAVAAVVSGSAALIAETAHSLADTGNRVLLRGRSEGGAAPDEEHPFGYGRERFFWARRGGHRRSPGDGYQGVGGRRFGRDRRAPRVGRGRARKEQQGADHRAARPNRRSAPRSRARSRGRQKSRRWWGCARFTSARITSSSGSASAFGKT